jgi:mevalonate kinase
MSSFFAPGKLLLSAEYSVLRGASAIAVPTKKGQWLETSSHALNHLQYTALDERHETWLNFNLSHVSKQEEQMVKDLLMAAFGTNPIPNLAVQTRLDFPRDWGLGSSSTFVSLIAQWAETDVWPLFFQHLKGSGYDVAVAEAKTSIKYQLLAPQKPIWEKIKVPPFFADTHLVYLGQKQNSALEVDRFLDQKEQLSVVEEISKLSHTLLQLRDIQDLEEWMISHEKLTSLLIGKDSVPLKVLPKLPGAAKSLGAWGGDFVWLSQLNNPSILEQAGFTTHFKFNELVDLS